VRTGERFGAGSPALVDWKTVDSSVVSPFLILEPSERRFPLGSGQSWAIGRGDGCTVLLENRSVSRLHALIQRKGAGDLALVDLGSRNGSFLNGKRVSFPVVLNDGDRLVFGDQELIFRNPGKSDSATPSAGADLRNEPTSELNTQALTTILVVDIRDFTQLARNLSEALLSETIGTWFLRTGQIAQRLGSWAQKYSGDAVMGVWVHDLSGHPDAEVTLALRAACEIQIATTEISRMFALPAPLCIGAGLNTGPAIIGGTDYTALGDTVNAAFRLESATKAIGLGVAIGERAYAALPECARNCFIRKEVALKGYDGERVVWAISFDGLREMLANIQ
jgi:adenylate cyclase